MALYRPDIPSMANGSQEGIVSPNRSAGSVQDITHDLNHLSIPPRTSSVGPVMHGSILSTPARSQISTPFQLQPAYGMMPVVYHGVPVSPPYAFDGMQPRSHTGIAPSSNYSLVSPLMSPSSSFASTELMTPRQFQPLNRGDGRRNNAMRVTRNSFYNQNTHHNHVDTNRIREGTDVRTTVSSQYSLSVINGY